MPSAMRLKFQPLTMSFARSVAVNTITFMVRRSNGRDDVGDHTVEPVHNTAKQLQLSDVRLICEQLAVLNGKP